MQVLDQVLEVLLGPQHGVDLHEVLGVIAVVAGSLEDRVQVDGRYSQIL